MSGCLVRNSRNFGFVIAAIAALLVSSNGRAIADVPNVLQDADPTFIESWQNDIDKQLELLTAAFGLDEDAKKSLRTELEQRMIQEYEYDPKMNAEVDELAKKAREAGVADDDNSPEVQALGRRFTELSQAMPLNENQVADWVASRLSPEAASEGKQRWEELVRRRAQMDAAKQDEGSRLSARKADFVDETREMQPRYSAESEAPLPRGNNGDFVDAETMRKAGRQYINPADIAAARERKAAGLPPDTGSSPLRSLAKPGPTVRTGAVAANNASSHPRSYPEGAEQGVAPGSPPRPPEPLRLSKTGVTSPLSAMPAPPAPPLDEWEKYVVSVSQKYGFDAGQNQRAEAILSDLRKRAYQYQLSRSEEYARAHLLTDANARSESMRRLNAPLDALFAELKQRLESLPTMAQKQKGGGAAGPAKPAPSKKGK
jgi:hypothetical protein